jgi:hypothetical protein
MDVLKGVDRQDLHRPIVRKGKVPRGSARLEMRCSAVSVHVHVTGMRVRPAPDLDAPEDPRIIVV